MSDLESRLRDEALRRSLDYQPSPELPDRIAARVDRRRRVRRLQVASTALAAAAAVVAAIVLVIPDAEQGSVRVEDGPTVTTAPEPSETPPTTLERARTGGTVERPVSPSSQITFLTPLSRHGIGPITAGMTLREAQAASGVAVTPVDGAADCFEAHIEGLEDMVELVVEPAASGDPMDGVVRAVAGAVAPTAEGASVGQMRDDLVAALGSPTDSQPAPWPWGSGDELLLFEADGFAYGALVSDGMVLGLQSGDPAWVDNPDGCPG